jgi:hypothetical protein
MAIKDRFIKKEEFMRLLFTKIDGVDTHELSMWLKSKTDDEFVVVPREFVYMTVLFFEVQAKEYKDRLPHGEMMINDLASIKNYL